ncbi:MAG TPA: VanZ family protein [Herpetosiphonaceae bacterium]|nr:VanZ family protein [Herpetosiphonaceae bacterium]
MACIFVLSSQSTVPTAPAGLPQELFLKAAHAAGYAVLALLIERALARPRHGRLLALLLTALYGLSDEYHQSFTPGRSPDAGDWLADVLGAVAALWLFRRDYWRKSSKFG